MNTVSVTSLAAPSITVTLLLQELAQKRGKGLPIYREVETRGPAHRRTFVYEVEFDGRVLARGEGSTKKAAQQEAARRALEGLEP